MPLAHIKRNHHTHQPVEGLYNILRVSPSPLPQNPQPRAYLTLLSMGGCSLASRRLQGNVRHRIGPFHPLGLLQFSDLKPSHQYHRNAATEKSLSLQPWTWHQGETMAGGQYAYLSSVLVRGIWTWPMIKA